MAPRQPDPSRGYARCPYLITLSTLVVYNAIGNTFLVGVPSFLSSTYDMSFVRSNLLALITGARPG